MSDQTIMIGITAALALLGVGALFMALFWPRRWRLKYRIEVGFVVLLAGLAVYADINSAQTYGAYEADLPTAGALAGAAAEASEAADFDRSIGVYAFQWGFVFLDEQGAASRNAIEVMPGQRILFTIFANDVIHGFNIPAARITTELEPGEVRRIWIRAPEVPGRYLIQCVNYCGLGHAQMKAWLIVDDETDDGSEDEDH